MRQSLTKGGSSGLISGVITTMGLRVGLHSWTQSRVAVVGGIATITVAAAPSEAFSMHMSQESNRGATTAQIRLAAAATFSTKL